MWADKACLIFFALSGLRTQAMNFDGRLEGTSSFMGVEAPDALGRNWFFGTWISYKDLNMPERIAIPIVPD